LAIWGARSSGLGTLLWQKIREIPTRQVGVIYILIATIIINLSSHFPSLLVDQNIVKADFSHDMMVDTEWVS
jgi:hypothetical protein